MLPYGALWKLDQELHPAGPPRKRTPALRRGRALFALLFACIVISLFLFPYYFARIRRLRTDLGNPSSKRYRQLQFEKEQQETKAKREKAVEELVERWHTEAELLQYLRDAFVFNERPPVLSRNHPYHAPVYISAIAAEGAGTVWPFIEGPPAERTVRLYREKKNNNLVIFPTVAPADTPSSHPSPPPPRKTPYSCRSTLLTTSDKAMAELTQLESSLYGEGKETSQVGVFYRELVDYHSVYIWLQSTLIGAYREGPLSDHVFSCLVPFYEILSHYRQAPLPDRLQCLCERETLRYQIVDVKSLLDRIGSHTAKVQTCAHVCALHTTALQEDWYTEETPPPTEAEALAKTSQLYGEELSVMMPYYAGVKNNTKKG